MKKLISVLLILCISIACFAVTTGELEASLLVNNPALRKAKEDASQALLDLKDAKAGQGPVLDLTISGSYIANPIDPIRVNLNDYVDGATYGLTNPQYITIYNGMESTYYSFGLQLTQPIFTWGKLSKAVDIYRTVYDARLLQQADEKDKALTELSTRLYASDVLLQLSQVLDEQKRTAQRLTELADSACENGMMLETEALQVRVQARQIDVASSQVSTALANMETAVSGLTGVSSFRAEDLEGAQEREEDVKILLGELKAMGNEGIMNAALSDERTTFVLLEKMKNISELTKGVASASVNWKPDLALVVNASYGGPRFPGIETDWYRKNDWNAVVTVALSTTVYDGGKAVRDVQRKASQLEQSTIDTDDARQKIRSAVQENLGTAELCLAKIEYNNAKLEQLKKEGEQKKLAFENGYGSEADCLQNLLEQNNCTVEILQNRITLATALFTLRYLSGLL
jgi:outer membrane protein TolC